MTALRNLALMACYGGFAVLVAFYLPQIQPGIDQLYATLGGVLFFFACALLHETCGRIERDSELAQQIADMRYDSVELRDDVSWMNREVKVVRDALEALAETGRGGQGGRALDDVLAEVKVLRSLVGRLSDTPPPAAAGSPLRRQASAAQPTIDVDSVKIATAAPDELDEEGVLEVVREALRDDRIELVLQPIVSLPQRKRRFYECFSRLSAGSGRVVVPAQYLAVAEREGLITAIDNMLLFRCIQLVRKIQRMSQNVGFFCNVSGHSLMDADFFGDFVDYLESNPDLAPHLVFEFSQSTFERLDATAEQHLERLARLGCRLSMDQITSLEVDTELLARLHIAFVKVEGAALLRQNAEGQAALLALRRRLDAIGVDLIAEKIEREEALLDLLDYGIDYGQGYLLGEPRLSRQAA